MTEGARGGKPRASAEQTESPAQPPREELQAGLGRGAPEPAAAALLSRLVALQASDGSWDLAAELAAALGRPWEKVESAFAAVMHDVGRCARAVDRAGELAGKSLQAWATVRTQQQERELADLLRSELRGIGGPLGSILAGIGETRDGLDQPVGGVLPTLQELLQFVESFRGDALREEVLRRAFATALAIRGLDLRAAESGDDGQSGIVRKASEWLQRAPLGARFWLDFVERSKLLR